MTDDRQSLRIDLWQRLSSKCQRVFEVGKSCTRIRKSGKTSDVLSCAHGLQILVRSAIEPKENNDVSRFRPGQTLGKLALTRLHAANQISAGRRDKHGRQRAFLRGTGRVERGGIKDPNLSPRAGG